MIRGKILKNAAISQVSTVSAPLRLTRVVPRAWFEAHGEAQDLLAHAKAEGDAIRHAARERAREELENARVELRAEEEARLAATFLELRAREEKLRTSDLERALGLGTILAERMLGQALSADPARVRSLAEGVLREARGARRFRWEVHPSDVVEIERLGESLDLTKESWSVTENAELAKGDVLLHTDLGTIDGRIRTQIERLRRALAE